MHIVSDEVFSDLSTVQTLTIPTKARIVEVQAQKGNVRFRIRTAPTATTGGIIYAGNWHTFRAPLDRVQLIADETNAEAYVVYGIE
ncbi:MAG: hypothetical protein ACYTEW_21460 [Planctomycetota bacterium]